MNGNSTQRGCAEGNRRGVRPTAITALLIVTVAALGLRLYALDAESLFFDELRQVSLYHLPASYVVTEATDHGQPPLDYLIGAALHRLGLAGSDWWVRLPAALFGAGCVLLLGWWIGRIAGAAAGTAASVLLAVCPFHLTMSQEARPYTIFFFFALASVLAFARAHRRHTFLSWCFFSAVFLGMLMTRWVGPHFITLGLGAFALCVWLKTRWNEDSSKCRAETLKLWAAFTSIVVAYAVYNPVFGIIFDRNRRAVIARETVWTNRLTEYLSEAYHAVFAGYSTRTVFSALPGNTWVLIPAAALALLGMVVLCWMAWRKRDPVVGLLLTTIVPFPFLYALVYVQLTQVRGKPQYLLLMAAPVLGLIAVAADSLRRWLSPAGRIASWLAFAGVVGAVAVPMGNASIRALQRQDKRDWRGAMTYLRDHVTPEDALAVVGADNVPPRFPPGIGGHARYGPPGVRFQNIFLDTPVEVLEDEPWPRSGNTVWIVGFNDRMYLGHDQLTTPTNPPPNMSVHAFNGLFIVEVRGETPAAVRLIDGLALITRDLPDHRSAVALNVFRGRYLYAEGDLTGAQACLMAACRQCRTAAEVQTLLSEFIPSELVGMMAPFAVSVLTGS